MDSELDVDAIDNMNDSTLMDAVDFKTTDTSNKNEKDEDDTSNETFEDIDLKGDDTEEGNQDENTEEETDLNFVQQVAKGLGFEDDELEEFDQSMESLVNVSKRLANKELNNLVQSRGQDFKEIYEYLENGGSLDEYLQKRTEVLTKYTVDNIKEDDVRTQEDILKEFYKNQGLDDEMIKEMITESTGNGTLYNQSLRLAKVLERQREQQKSAILEQQKLQREQQEKDAEQYIEKVTNYVTTNEIYGIKLNGSEGAQFMSYIFDAQEDGLSGLQKDIQNASVEDAVGLQLMAYMLLHKKVKPTEFFGKLKASKSARDLLANIDSATTDELLGRSPKRSKDKNNETLGNIML